MLFRSSTGSVSGIIRIPLAATGFTLPGSKAGVIFIDAIGTGPGGAHVDDVAMQGLAKPGGACSTTQFHFKGFDEPVGNFPRVNAADAGESIAVKFDLAGIHAPLKDVLASGYPQSAPVSCSNPATLTSGEPTVSDEGSHVNDDYTYVWETMPSWRGCRELIVKLTDGSYHLAVFDFSS